MEKDTQNTNGFSEVFVNENGKKGVKLHDGKIVVPANYDEIVYVYDKFTADSRPYVAIKDGKFGLVKPDGKGTVVAPFVYDNISVMPDIPNHYLYKTNNSQQFGILSFYGCEITPCIIDSYSCNGQTIYFNSNNRRGLWQWVINELLEPIYDNIEVLDIEEPTLFTLNGEKGYVKVEDHSFIPESLRKTMDEDAWHDLLLECICDQYADF